MTDDEEEQRTMSQRDQLGARALELLAEQWMIPVLQALSDGSTRPAELERRLPHVGHSTVIRRLRRLLDSELVTYERRPGTPPHARSAGTPQEAHYELTDAGRMLLEVTAHARRWERIWCARTELRGPAGVLAVRLLADRHTRKTMLVLADGWLCTKGLDELVPDLGRSALRRRVRELVLAGLLEQHKSGRVPQYALTAAARHLASVAMLAGRWEWLWSRPAHPAPGSDLHSLFHVLAPVARIPEPVAGICQLHVDPRGADDPTIYLAAQAGNVRALADAPTAPPEAVGHGTPEAWCEALLLREGPITVSGDRALLTAIMGALSTALLA
jgi:DNA-binding HxlR family transcriptional regulator